MDLLGSIVAASPCPPLPLQVMRPDSKTGKEIVGFANTHHILMQAYVHAMRRNCEKDNAQREKTQTSLTNVLLAEFCDESNNSEQLYNACTTFTRAYIHAFMPLRPIVDARFAPYDEIASDTYGKNPIIRSCCEHLAGLIYYDENGTRNYDEILEPLKTMSFSQVLAKYAQVHITRSVGIPTLTDITEE
jgi:hypothetical protein